MGISAVVTASVSTISKWLSTQSVLLDVLVLGLEGPKILQDL